MKLEIVIRMLFDLLLKRKLSASYFAEKYAVSKRSVYRYVELLSTAVPLQVTRGRNGGIQLSDAYKLPFGFLTKDEYDALCDALALAYANEPNERFLRAKRKLTSEIKTERRDLTISGDPKTVYIDGATWGDLRPVSEKLKIFERCVKERCICEVSYRTSDNTLTTERIEPHLLLLRNGIWYTYAFCRTQRAFSLMRLSQILSAVVTDAYFFRRPCRVEDVPVDFHADSADEIQIRLQIDETALPLVEEAFGAEQIHSIDGKYYAEPVMTNDDMLVSKLLSLGAGVKILAPAKLADKLRTTAKKITQLYS